MAVLNNRDQILSRKPKTIEVTLPDREDTVTVRRTSAMDLERLKAAGAESNTGLQLAMVLCDENGKRIFDPDDPGDFHELTDMFGVDETAAILNAAGGLIVKKEDTEKKSEASPSTDSATA